MSLTRTVVPFRLCRQSFNSCTLWMFTGDKVTKCASSCAYAISNVGQHRKFASHSAKSDTKIALDMSEYPPERIRNFSIIAHIDHGKSTLADRLLETTATIVKSSDNKQILDKLQVERERGITVKAQTATMVYEYEGEKYLLNLIDTPGHVDFSYEVARAIEACQGVILLVDANQGVQAQTVANFYLAFAKGLVVIPVLNKIDLKNADPERVLEQLYTLFEINPESVLKVSAKVGIGIDELLQEIVKRLPAPEGNRDNPAKALIFDSWYDRYRGVALMFALKDGKLSLGNNITLAQSNKSYEIKEIGILNPNPSVTNHLHAGQVGYIFCNMRSPKEALMGATIHLSSSPVEALAGFVRAKPMVYAGVYPMDQSEHLALRSAIEKLVLNDSSLECAIESSPALGSGWRVGFLGVLHMEVFMQRLEQEYDAEVVLTSPNVPLKVTIFGAKNIKSYGAETFWVKNPCSLPSPDIITEMFEPFVSGTIITPGIYVKEITELCIDRRGVQLDTKNIDDDRMLLTFKLPLTEIIVDFYDKLKSVTSGYASFDYEELGYESSSLTKMDILLNGELVEEMCTIVHSTKAREIGKSICARLTETIPKHQFVIAVQAVVGGKVIARDNIKAWKKDVTAKLKSGSDLGRKQKLLRRQAEGKARMKQVGKISLPRETFIKVLQR